MLGARNSPVFIVKIGNLELTNPENPRQMTFSFREMDGGAKKLTLKIANINLELIDHPDLVKGAKAEFRFGYSDWLSNKFTGTVREVNPSFDPGDISLTLGIFDAVSDTMAATKLKVWQQLDGDATQITESDIVTQIAAEYGLTAEVEPTRHYYSEIAQSEEDFTFLKRLAKQAKPADASMDVGPYRVTFDHSNSKLIFKPVNINTPVRRTFRYMTETDDPSLISFRPRATTYDPDTNGGVSTGGASVTPNGKLVTELADNDTETQRVSQGGYLIYDAVTGDVSDPILAVASVSETMSDVGGNAPVSADGVEAEATNVMAGAVDTVGEMLGLPLPDDPLFTEAFNQAAASNNFMESELDKVQADLEVLGDPDLRRGEVVEILNVGREWSGEYLCFDVEHRIDSNGYVTYIELKRNALGTKDGAAGASAGHAAGKGSDGSDSTEDAVDDSEPSYYIYNATTGEVTDPTWYPGESE